MRKLIVGMIGGAVITGALVVTFIGPLYATPAAAEEPESTNPPEMSTDNTTFRENIYSLLQRAGNEIEDSDLSQFYQRLVETYELGEPPPGETGTEEPSPADILPDINKISRAALVLPLQEAGKNIQDEELAQFYYKLLASAGWSIEPD